MVYIKSWTDFESAATDLYAKAPTKVRYLVKFLPKSGELVLKLTDDTTCINYKTFSSIILNRFESLNLRLLSQMTNCRPRLRPTSPSGAPEGAARATSSGMEVDDPMAGTAPTAEAEKPPAAKKGGGGATGGKKKKKGKK